MSVKVKICGIRDVSTALASVEAGADFLGFNFVRSSKRYIEPKEAVKIAEAVDGRVKIVGVFRDEDYRGVNGIAKLLKLDFVQLHGNEDEEYILKIKYDVIKKIPVLDFQFSKNLKFLLLDREEQGKGEMVDLRKAKQIANKYSVFFSGGLTPENVRKAVEMVKPFAVDVASGVETDGKKDILKIEKFIRRAKELRIENRTFVRDSSTSSE